MARLHTDGERKIKIPCCTGCGNYLRLGAKMKWLKRLKPGTPQSSVPTNPNDPKITMPGWRMVEDGEKIKVWQDVDGDALSLTYEATFEPIDLSDVDMVRRNCRVIAEKNLSGLIEVTVSKAVDGPAIMFIYKRRDKLAYIFTGILVVMPNTNAPAVWAVVARERGTTGIREAIVTAQLMNEGKITIESYKTSFAQDPYDPTYAGVDKSNLRFISDDEKYDSVYPLHPLSKVRRELRKLLTVKLNLPLPQGPENQ